MFDNYDINDFVLGLGAEYIYFRLNRLFYRVWFRRFRESLEALPQNEVRYNLTQIYRKGIKAMVWIPMAYIALFNISGLNIIGHFLTIFLAGAVGMVVFFCVFGVLSSRILEHVLEHPEFRDELLSLRQTLTNGSRRDT